MASYDIKELGSKLTFTSLTYPSVISIRIPGQDRIAVLWIDAISPSGVVYVQSFDINKRTGAESAIGSPLDIDTTAGPTFNGVGTSLIAIDSSNLMAFFVGEDLKGYCQLLSVSASGVITTNGSLFNYDSVEGIWPGAVLLDSTHVCVVSTRGSTTRETTLEINTGTGTITSLFSTEISSFESQYPSVKLIAPYTLLLSASMSAFQRPRILAFHIDAPTWTNVDILGNELELEDTINQTIGNDSIVVKNDGTNIDIIRGYITYTGQNYQLCTIVLSTLTSSKLGSKYLFATTGMNGEHVLSMQKVNNLNFVSFFCGQDSDGYARIYNYNGDRVSPIIATVANQIDFETTIFQYSSSCT